MKSISFVIFLLFTLLATVSNKAQNTAIYDITFTSIWNANDHTSLPAGAHWSKLVGVTHKSTSTFLQVGALASTGIKNIAELGDNNVFNDEVTIAITNNEADQYINGPNLGTASGTMNISGLVVNRDFPLLTLVSMIAPSPDWMIALDSYSLLDASDDWKISETIDIFALDAGTDDGSDYNSTNIASNPFESISQINGAPFNGNKIGTLTITLISILSTENLPLSKVNIFPNPVTEGILNLTYFENYSLKNIDIYTITGSLVKSIVPNENINKIEIPFLPPGIYLLQLINNEDQHLVKKFVVE